MHPRLMKKLLLSIIVLFSSLLVKGQAWFPFSSGIAYDRAAYFVQTLTAYNNNLFAGGVFDTAGGKPANNIAKWDGTSWHALGKGANSSVYASTVYNGHLIVGGYFDTIDGVPASHIASWNDTAWSTLGGGISGQYSCVNVLMVYNGHLIAGGVFDTAGGIPAMGIAEWDGKKWSTIGTGIYGTVWSLTSFNGNLIAGGYFDIADGSQCNYVTEWNGTSWNCMGKGMDNIVWAVDSFHNRLYASGWFDSAGGVSASHIAVWDGASWSRIGTGLTGAVEADAMIIKDGSLYIGGYFSFAGGVPANDIVKWNDTIWSPLGSGIPNGNGINQIEVLTIYQNNIIAGGQFDTAGFVYANNIAGWVINPEGMENISVSNSLKVFPNPSNGKFTIQSSVVSGQSLVEIYNEMGQKVASSNYSEGGAFKSLPWGGQGWALDLSNQPAGIYLYRVITHEGELVGSGKLIIQ
jgi:trimeric autotransporter adhesin